MKSKMCKRWIWIGTAFVLLAVSALSWWQLARVWPMGTGPAGPPVPRSEFETVWDERPVLLVGIGDSITAGFGAKPGRSYFERLVKTPVNESADVAGLCLSRAFPNLKATNLSVSGSTSPQHIRTQLPKLNRQPTNVLGIVVMTTGGNDIIHNYGKTPPSEGAMYGATFEQAGPWISNFAQRLEQMLVQITNAFPGGCEIFLANIYDPTDTVGDISKVGLPPWPDGTRILAKYNRIIEEAAQRHHNVHLVDIYSEFLGHGIHCRQFWRKHYNRSDPHYWYHYNVEDPNDRGYDALRRLFLNRIREIFRPTAAASAPANERL